MRKNFNHQIGEYPVLQKWSDMEYKLDNDGKLRKCGWDVMSKYIDSLRYVLIEFNDLNPTFRTFVKSLYDDLRALKLRFIEINEEEGIENE